MRIGYFMIYVGFFLSEFSLDSNSKVPHHISVDVTQLGSKLVVFRFPKLVVIIFTPQLFVFYVLHSAGAAITTEKAIIQFNLSEFYAKTIIQKDVYVFDNELNYDMIIGRDLMTELGISLDFFY